MAADYDDEAEAVGWHGPEVAFGLAFRFVQPGDSVLDLGIGTGLAAALFRKAGLRVTGMDADQEMVDACRARGFTDLARHDLTRPPYPFADGGFDHAVCVGVFNFLRDPGPVIAEVARLLRPGGAFAFTVGHREEGEAAEFPVGAEHTGVGAPATLYRHSAGQVQGWLAAAGLAPVRELAFGVPLGRERAASMPARAHLARKGG